MSPPLVDFRLSRCHSIHGPGTTPAPGNHPDSNHDYRDGTIFTQYCQTGGQLLHRTSLYRQTGRVKKHAQIVLAIFNANMENGENHPFLPTTSFQGGRMGTITWKIYPDLKMAHFKGFGDVSYGMIIDRIRHLYSHPEWRFHFNTFIDFADAVMTTEAENFSKYREFFENLRQTGPVRKWAIHTRQDSPRQAADIGQLLNSRNIIVDVFKHRDDALRFIDVTPQQFTDPANIE
jgi:hypothetical protein